MRDVLQQRQEQRAHNQPLPVARQHEGRQRAGACTKDGQVPAITRLFQVWRAAFDVREMEQRRAGKGLRRRWEGGGVSILRRFVGGYIRSQTRISGCVEEVVRQSEGGCTVEGEHGGILGIVDRRRRGNGLSSGTGVHVLHGGYLINDRAGISVFTFRRYKTRECIMSAGRKRRDESARQERRSFIGQVEGTGSRMKMGTGESGKRRHAQYQQAKMCSSK